jgi:hypothetical protein
LYRHHGGQWRTSKILAGLMAQWPVSSGHCASAHLEKEPHGAAGIDQPELDQRAPKNFIYGTAAAVRTALDLAATGATIGAAERSLLAVHSQWQVFIEISLYHPV